MDPVAFVDLVKFYGIPGSFMIGGALWLKNFFDNYFKQQSTERESERTRQLDRETRLTERLTKLEDWSRNELSELLKANTVALNANTLVHEKVLSSLDKEHV